MRRGLALTALLLTGSLGSGCAWLTPGTQPSTAAPSSYPVVTSSGNQVRSLPEGVTFDRKEVESAASSVVSCDSGTLEITSSEWATALDSPCDTVTVTGDLIVLTADHIGHLVIRGYGVVVLVGSVDSITLEPEGSGHVVQWESGEPQIDNQTTGSLLTKAS